jgi:acyl-coenzyme A synthetase/AMP-(fatty) acid ligase
MIFIDVAQILVGWITGHSYYLWTIKQTTTMVQRIPSYQIPDRFGSSEKHQITQFYTITVIASFSKENIDYVQKFSKSLSNCFRRRTY